MRDTLDTEQPTCGSPERFGVRRDEISEDVPGASVQPNPLFQPHTADWEKWIVRVSEWAQDPGREDCDGVVWPTEHAIQIAFRMIDQMRSQNAPEPTNLVPAGDGGIVFMHRAGINRMELEISDVGDIELLLFSDGRLVDRVPR